MSSTILREINQFNELADTWWNTEGPMWPLHKLNALRLPFVLRHMRTHFGANHLSSKDAIALRDLSVLDIGCGAGILSESIARTGASVTGIDAAERNITMASAHAKRSNLAIDYQHKTLEEMDATQYDVVLNMEVVEHVADVEQFLNDSAAKTKPGGLMFVATINRTVYSAITAILGAEYILGWLPKGTHQWRQFVTPKEVRQQLRLNNLSVLEQTGVAVNPFRKSLSLTHYTGGNYMLVAQRKK